MKKIHIRQNPSPHSYLKIMHQLAGLKISYGKDMPAPLAGNMVDPQINRMLKVYNLIPRKTDLPERSPWRARQIINTESKLQKILAPTKDFIPQVTNLRIPAPGGEMWVRAYHPLPGKDLPVLVYYHGGGWVTGSPDTHNNLTRALAKQAGCLVLSVDYRLAPEHKFPAGVEDAFFALQWAAKNASLYGGNPDRLAVGGDSSGGNLAAVICQMARDQGGPAIACQILFYAALDLANLDRPSHLAYGKDYGLTQSEYTWYVNQYLNCAEEALTPLASPLLAENLSHLPPAFIVTSEFDILRDEGEAYAQKLNQANTAVNLHRENGMIHGFLSMLGIIDRADAAMREITDEIRLFLKR